MVRPEPGQSQKLHPGFPHACQGFKNLGRFYFLSRLSTASWMESEGARTQTKAHMAAIITGDSTYYSTGPQKQVEGAGC